MQKGNAEETAGGYVPHAVSSFFCAAISWLTHPPLLQKSIRMADGGNADVKKVSAFFPLLTQAARQAAEKRKFSRIRITRCHSVNYTQISIPISFPRTAKGCE